MPCERPASQTTRSSKGVFVACLFNAIDRLADTFGLYELMQLREP